MPHPHTVPPAPQVMAALFADYLQNVKPQGLSFGRYLRVIGFRNPARGQPCMDDDHMVAVDESGLARIDIPHTPVLGELSVKVLLIDFPDRVGLVPPRHYERMLFSRGVYPTGSMADFFDEVSHGRVGVGGRVHGWLRMPRDYAFYTNDESGTEWESYPRNAPRMVEDAVRAAQEAGILFEPYLDKLGQGVVTALFVIHAGRGAEELHPSISGSEIWSHKWQLRKPIRLTNGLFASMYLTVPQDCKVGVCAHELGHLAFQWQDFYDPNYDEDGWEWDGAGRWDLMAGGSYNGGGARPAHPAGLHKLQHGWIPVDEIAATHLEIALDPITSVDGRVLKLISPAYRAGQYLILENRARQGFDFDLPGQGLLVWRVDEAEEQTRPDRPGMLLIQADGRHHLENPNDWNQGDGGDPFPGTARRFELTDSGGISTSFPGQPPSGISLRNIRHDGDDGRVMLDILCEPPDGAWRP